MNYRHIYHAGNFADLVKHIILIALVNNIKIKEKPFAILDAFAGIGLYDLRDEKPNKTSEYNNGIGLLSNIQNRSDKPKLIEQYLNIISKFNSSSLIEYYPGSPMIIESMLRPNDRLILSELHKEDYLELKKNMMGKNAEIHHIDAYNAIKAFFPPKEKRGLIFIDPAFEIKNEFDKLITSLQYIKASFLTGTVMIWFPVKDKAILNDFYKKYKTLGYKETLLLEFSLKKQNDPLDNKMNKFGILIINPPPIKDEILSNLDYISSELYGGNAKFKLELI